MAQQRVQHLKKSRKDLSDNYLLYLPAGYTESGAAFPLLLFLHGTGERGTNTELVKKHGPPKLADQGQEFPFIIVSPQCPDNKRWSVKGLNSLLKEVTGEYRVDMDRIYVTGLSIGGYGTWDLAIAYPERFAAIAPICGGADKSRANLIKDLPVWVFHGAKDDVVKIKEAEDIVNALKRLGSPVKFTVYSNAGHDAWTETYNNVELYKWMLEQRRVK